MEPAEVERSALSSLGALSTVRHAAMSRKTVAAHSVAELSNQVGG